MDGLRRIDADVSLIFLSANAILYTGEVNDPLYSAHQPLPSISNTLTGNETTTMYIRDEPAAVLGCVAQYQACNSKLTQDRECTPPSGIEDVLNNVRKIATNEEEVALFNYYLAITLGNYQFHAPTIIAFELGEWSLTSRFTLNQGVQAQLPDNQWQLDVEYWHEISMASLQSAVVNAATGPSDPSILEVWRGPQNAEERKVCQNTVRLRKPEPPSSPIQPESCNLQAKPLIPRVPRYTPHLPLAHADSIYRQKTRSNEHTNFSVFGLAFVFTTGTLLILLSWFLEPCVAYIQKRGGWAWFCFFQWWYLCRRKSSRHRCPPPSFSTNAYARLEWSANETLQLQRLAHEELGVGPWEACDSAVPVTARKGERLGVLEMEDWTHPRLKAPLRDLEEECVVGPGEGEEGEGKKRERADCRAGTEKMVVGEHEGSESSSTVVAEMRPDGA